MVKGRKKDRFSIKYRAERNTWRFWLHEECGLPPEIIQSWQCKSLAAIPYAVRSRFPAPASTPAAKRIIEGLIDYLKDNTEAAPVVMRGTNIGQWIEKFTDETKSPRAKRLLAKNIPYSPKTIYNYKSIFETHLAGDPFLSLAMERVTEDDLLGLLARIQAHKINIGCKRAPQLNEKTGTMIDPSPLPTRPMAGTRAYEAIYSFIRMTFKEYQMTHKKFLDPFLQIERPKPVKGKRRDCLEEAEIVQLFLIEGVFDTELDRAICAAMFWAGLRRSEIFGLLPGDLDWFTPKIDIGHAWKNFDSKERVLLDPKHHKHREAPFPDILQNAIKALWEKNGKHKYVFAFNDGTIPKGTWFREHSAEWFRRAGIDIAGRKITPHSSRHSLASILESQGVPLRYIQDMLGHSDLKTTYGYLHSPQNTINKITKKIEKKTTRGVLQFPTAINS